MNPWGGIYFHGPEADDSRLEGCVLKHNRGYSLSIYDELYNYWYEINPGIAVSDASPTITGCEITDSTAQYGIYIENGSPEIAGNTINTDIDYGIYAVSGSPEIMNNTITGLVGWGIEVSRASSPVVTGNTVSAYGTGIAGGVGTYQNNIVSGARTGIRITDGGTCQGNTLNNNEYGVYVSYYNESPNSIISGNSYSNNSKADVYASGTIKTAAVWGDAGDTVFEIPWRLTIAEGGSLTIQPGGKTVKVYGDENGGGYFNVAGILIATNVTFTWADGVNPWGGIYFYGSGANASRLENCVLEHAQGYTHTFCDIGSEYCNDIASVITVSKASPTITGCGITKNTAACGIGINYGSPAISNSTISGMDYGLYIIAFSSPIVTGNTLSQNHDGIYLEYDSTGNFQGNAIVANTAYGIHYTGTSIIDATGCNWGDATGPLDDSDDRASGGWYNPNGLGNKVSNHINYGSWVIPADDDNDGLSNDLENAGPTNPSDPDTDDDGLIDGVEDGNHNGVVDVWETDPCKADTDGDGVSDKVEIDAGSDPLDPNSIPRIQPPSIQGPLMLLLSE